MATILQRQLAEIAAKSTHQLDLKAQKAQHARSLLFDPADASRQSFDIIYQLCREGFDEMCQLDSRFLSFANNLFANDSMSVDRGQLTQAENTALDRVVETYLGLINGRLLLKPAQKSLEWLVRRWRIHEFTPTALLMTALPYHKNEPLFPAVLALLSDDRQLPEAFKWLHPYVASRSCPPEHAILAAAISNRSFFSAFNAHTLRIAKSGHASGMLLAYWAGLALKAVNGMLDSSRSGRVSINEQQVQDLLLTILPVLCDAFRISKDLGLDEMYVGVCMVCMLIATKAELADVTLDALMETVSSAWTDRTTIGGLSCLVALAEAKRDLSLPPVVTLQMLEVNALPTIVQLAQSQRVSKLAAGFALGVWQHSHQKKLPCNLDLIRDLLAADIIDESHKAQVLEKLITDIGSKHTGLLSEPTRDLLSLLSNDEGNQILLRQLGESSTVSKPVLQALHDIQTQGDIQPSDVVAGEIEMADVPIEVSASPREEPEDMVELLNRLPKLPRQHFSFLDRGEDDSGVFGAFSLAFSTAASREGDLQLFTDRLLDDSTSQSNITLLSFLARLWSTAANRVSAHAKVKALDCAARIIQHSLVPAERLKVNGAGINTWLSDSQALYPYLFTALSDRHQNIRAAAGRVFVIIDELITLVDEHEGAKAAVWAKETIYGTSSASSIAWLSTSDSYAVVHKILIPTLDDCILNAEYLKEYLAELLSTAKSASSYRKLKTVSKEQQTTLRDFIASHAMATPSMQTRLQLLEMLGAIRKGADATRARHLVPLLKQWASASEEQLRAVCEKDGTRPREIEAALLSNLWQCSGNLLSQAREICLRSNRPTLMELMFDYETRLWTSTKSAEAKVHIVQRILELALDHSRFGESIADSAVQTLKSLETTPEIMISLLEMLPKVADLQSQPPPSKKQRRASDAAQNRSVAHAEMQVAIRRLTLILELLEQSRLQSPKLLQPLFHLLAELRHLKTMSGSALTYLHSMTLEALLTAVKKIPDFDGAEGSADWSFVRIDLLIDCIRTSSSPQVQDTAVLLVSALACWIPDSVLHSVMPLFTFMSTTILQRNDEYSAHIAEQAIARIVPALALSLTARGKNVLVGVSEMLLSFVAAWEHVPLHRRLLTFEMVVDAIGAKSCLGAVSAMLAERYPETGAPVSSFIVELICRRTAVEIVEAANQWLELVTRGMQVPSSKTNRNANVSDVLFAMTEKDEDEREETIERLIDGLRNLLRNEEIKKALASSLGQGTTDELQTVYSSYASLLESAIRLTQDISSTTTLTSEAPSQLLSAILDLLPTTDFIASSTEIMQAGSDNSREMVFQSLESRVQASRSNNVADSQVFLNLLPSCSAFVQVNQSAVVSAAAIGCIDAICEKFGKTDPIIVKDAASTVAGQAALGSNNVRLRTLSLLCLASIAGVLEDGDESLSIFPPVLDVTLDLLAASNVGISTAERDAGFRLLTALLDHSPWILTTDPGKLDRALRAGAKFASSQSEAVREFLHLAARTAPAAELFTSVERVCIVELQGLNNVEDATHVIQCLSALIDTLQQAVFASSKATITKNASVIFRLLLSGFDLPRRLRAAVRDTEILDLQDLGTKLNSVALDVTLKINDATFRPFFIQLVDWATPSSAGMSSKEEQEKLIALYSFALLLFERLGALVISYMSFVLESTHKILSTPARTSTQVEMVRLVVQVLDSSFRGDEDDFWTAPAHFDRIEDVLIGRLCMSERQAADENKLLVETVANFAGAVNASPEQLKRINTHLLSIARHQQADVRLAALQCQRAITAKVNFDWLALLPEMLPVISELQEDDDERVERETLRWVQEIEDISGESLEGMLA